MTEKRFTTSGDKIYDTFHDGVHWLVNEAEEIVEVMNNLDLKARERSKALSKLQKENEQLKSRIKDYDVALKKLQDLTDKKLKENEQLKHDATVLIYSNQEYRKGNEQLKQLAEGNEELLLKVMSYLHDNHYDIWEEVNKECFLKELGDD